VAQIAKAIATKLNFTHPYFRRDPINLDLVEFAALAHDIGHPPFGHNGEESLDRLMVKSGGFEGNAQTLRILAVIEKKETSLFPSGNSVPVPTSGNDDKRKGLNVTFRSLASVIKYDREIPHSEKERIESATNARPCKGYYAMDAEIVNDVRANVLGGSRNEFRTIECSIMDVADDIAYSTYDIEDSFKAGFLSPISMLSASHSFKEKIAVRVKSKLNIGKSQKSFEAQDVHEVLLSLFRSALEIPDEQLSAWGGKPISAIEAGHYFSSHTYGTSKEISSNGYLRSLFTSQLVGQFIGDIELEFNETTPKCSIVRLKHDTKAVVETLKAFAVFQLIESPMLKFAQKRCDDVIGKIFNTLSDDSDLLPHDWKEIFKSRPGDATWQQRVICDYVAGMTDRYCIEFYSRITGVNPATIWKPH
jgi:dGTPase